VAEGPALQKATAIVRGAGHLTRPHRHHATAGHRQRMGSPDAPVIPQGQYLRAALARRRRVERSLYTGLWTPAFGRWLYGHLVPSDTGRFRHWSLQALVGIGSGWCEKPTRSTGSFNSRPDKEFHPINNDLCCTRSASFGQPRFPKTLDQ
jgi:hypothetical protein